MFSCSVMSDSLWSHGLQHAWLLCPPLSPGVCLNSCPLSQWCHPTIASSVALFFCFQFFPASGSVPTSRLFAPDSQSTGASASVLPMNIQGWFLSFRIDKVHLVKAMVFPVVMYGFEIWTIKKAEHWRIDSFELWCWRRLLRVPWTARRSKDSILKDTSPENSLEGLMLKLKLQYFGHLMWRANSWKRLWCWESLKAGGEAGDRGWNGYIASLTQWTWIWANSGR